MFKKTTMKSDFTKLNLEQQEKIIDVLKQKKYKGRTLNGISSETKIAADLIKANIKWNNDFARKLKILPNRTDSGKVLITTKERFVNDASLKEKFTDFFATKRQEIEVGE